jgi:predicted RNase H-like HicB family nuclease
MKLSLEVDREEDGRWIAEVIEIAGALAYGDTREEAIRGAKAIAFAALGDRSRREDIDSVEFVAVA